MSTKEQLPRTGLAAPDWVCENDAFRKHVREANCVYLVPTGEVHEGQETYTRHDERVPNADQEVLFADPDAGGARVFITASGYRMLAGSKTADAPLTREPFPARKIGGSYQAEGTIVSTFKTTAGEQRVVFEFNEPRGMLHIFTESQVERLRAAGEEKPNQSAKVSSSDK